jgi:predicted CoA-binding protein
LLQKLEGKELDKNNLIIDILKKYHVIAVVGLSRDHSKDSFIVANYMKRNGYQIIPVNPFAKEILNEKSYPNLLELPREMQRITEIVNIFRPSNDVLPIVKQSIRLKKKWGMPQVIWMQLGIINNEAAEIAREEGFSVVMDKCIMREHIKFRRKLT